MPERDKQPCPASSLHSNCKAKVRGARAQRIEQVLLEASEALSERGATPRVLREITPKLCQAFGARGWGFLLPDQPIPRIEVLCEKGLSDAETEAICAQAMMLYSEWFENGSAAKEIEKVYPPAGPRSVKAEIVLGWRMVAPDGFHGLIFLVGPTNKKLSPNAARLFCLFGNHLAAAFSNVQLHERLKAEIGKQDPLVVDQVTGLPGPKCFYSELGDELKRAARYGQHLCCLLVDMSPLVRLKRRWGQNAFDAGIQRVAELLENNMRDVDLVARISQARFACLLPNTEGAGGRALARRIMSALATLLFPSEVDERPIPLGTVPIKVCVAQARKRGESPKGLVKRMEKAIRKNNSGGKCAIFTAPMRG